MNIQESHLALEHIYCMVVERFYFGEDFGKKPSSSPSRGLRQSVRTLPSKPQATEHHRSRKGVASTMKKLTALILFVATLTASAQKAEKKRFSDPVPLVYPLKFHASRSFFTINGGVYMHLVGVIGGAKVELMSGPSPTDIYSTGLLNPGDYPARVTGQETKKDGSTIQAYDLQLANGQHEEFTVIGRSE